MPQLSKLIRSRDEWRAKAIQRANENREHRKAQQRNRAQITALKQQLKQLQKRIDTDKKTLTPDNSLVERSSKQDVRTLCVLLVIQAVVSYRSIPRILTLLEASAENLRACQWRKSRTQSDRYLYTSRSS